MLFERDGVLASSFIVRLARPHSPNQRVDLMLVGPVVAFNMDEQVGFKPCLNLLHAMGEADSRQMDRRAIGAEGRIEASGSDRRLGLMPAEIRSIRPCFGRFRGNFGCQAIERNPREPVQKGRLRQFASGLRMEAATRTRNGVKE